MIRVTIQLPPDPNAALAKKVLKLAQGIASSDGDEVIEQPGAAPAETYGLTVHELADPETPGNPEE